MKGGGDLRPPPCNLLNFQDYPNLVAPPFRGANGPESANLRFPQNWGEPQVNPSEAPFIAEMSGFDRLEPSYPRRPRIAIISRMESR